MRGDPPLPLLIERRAEVDPDGVLLQWADADADESATWRNAEFLAATRRIASGLAALGVGAGDRIAVMLPTVPAAHACWIGIAWLRAWEVPVNPEFRGTFLRHVLADSGASVVITDRAGRERIAAVAAELPDLRHVVEVEDLAGAAEYVPDLTPREQDPYAVIYTSGTTGPAKGVVMPWANLHVSAGQMFPGDEAKDYDDGAYYCPWPTFHSAAKMSLLYAVEYGLRLVMRSKFSVSSFWSDIRRYGCTHTHLIGLAGYLMAAPPAPDDAHNPLRRTLVNPMPSNFRKFETRFGVRVSTGWGMTEIGFPVSTGEPSDPASCGRLSPLYEARIVDADDYDVVDGEVGELVIRAQRPWLMLTEYLNRPQATARAWRNGWFHTGDALRRTADGDYYFVDRIADYVRTRGNNVSSLEVEAEVRTHPEVADCACVGVPAELEGDFDVKIFVVRTPGSRLTAESLGAYLAERMPRHMQPRHVEFRESLPRTPTGKVRKIELHHNHGQET